MYEGEYLTQTTMPFVLSPSTLLNGSLLLEYERRFNRTSGKEWMDQNHHTCFYFSSLYLILIFSIKHYMKDKSPFQLRLLLANWNAMLAIFSIVGTWRTWPALVERLTSLGLTQSFCCSHLGQIMDFWGFVFVMSKLPELGDTIFIVLRKQKLVFLHWYHHITVLFFCWYNYKYYFPPGVLFMHMNFIVHSLMYTYFAIRALGFKLHRAISMFITLCQILQMILGVAICLYSYIVAKTVPSCEASATVSKMGLLMYSSYLVLFSKLFYDSYITSKRNFPEKYKIH